jgi:hypothetical protein
MKISTIRNALIKQTLVVIVILAVIFAPVFYVDSLHDEYEKGIVDIKAKVDSVAAEANSLLAQYEAAHKGITAYNEIKQKQDQKLLTVSKVSLRDIIVGIRKKYNFDNFEADMSDVRSRGAQYKLSSLFAESSDVTLKFNASSDIDVFLLIQSLQNSFPLVKISSISLSLVKGLDSQALLQIKNAGLAPLVNAEIKFIWSGLRNVKTDDANPQVPAKPVGAEAVK